MKLQKQYKIRNFLILSMGIHLFLAYSIQNLKGDKKKPETTVPIRIKFIELEEGQIFDTPKPKKIEKPKTKSILAKYDSRAHSNKSDIKKNYRSPKTVIPRSESKPEKILIKKITRQKKKIPDKKILKEKAPQEKIKIVKKKLKKKDEIEIVIEKKDFTNKNQIKSDPIPQALKGLFKEKEITKNIPEKRNASLFKGFDPKKFAKYDTRDKEDESDTETVHLDTQEFKYASYFATIKEQIQRVWSYPEQAAINGLQGELLLQFVLDRSGRIVDISLIDSSGHKILDVAALDAVKTASPFNPYPPTIRKKKLRIIASFRYKPSYTLYE